MAALIFLGERKMTEKELIQNVINIAEDFLGCNEHDGSHRSIIDIYNSLRPLPRNYQVKYTDAWCATFISVVYQLAGLQNIVGRECGCEEFIKIFKSKGIWIEDGTITPERGDIILYNWDDNTQPNNGYADHIGIVTDVNDATRIAKIIEGNINDKVGYRNVSFGAGFIRGYARPDYKSVVKSENHEYKNIGWNKDENGWWYAYGRKVGEYHKNNAVRINSDLYFFDVDGYCVMNPNIETDNNGVLRYIRGNRVI